MRLVETLKQKLFHDPLVAARLRMEAALERECPANFCAPGACDDTGCCGERMDT